MNPTTTAEDFSQLQLVGELLVEQGIISATNSRSHSGSYRPHRPEKESITGEECCM